jgi:phosphate transport system permease protein
LSSNNSLIPTQPSLYKRWSLTTLKEQCIRVVLFGCALVSVATTVGIIGVLLIETGLFFSQVSPLAFFGDTVWQPQSSDEPRFGIWPLAVGTFLVAGVAGVIGLPLGLLSALYLSEYASDRNRSILKPALEILAGIPSIVFGYFALVFVTPHVLRPIFMDGLGIDVGQFNVLSAGIVVGIMIVPTISSLSEDVLRSVPRGLREAGLALGSTKFDVSVRIVLPAALSGILAAFLLALSRAIGETMAVTIAAGSQPDLTLNVFRAVETMTAYIVLISLGEAAEGSLEKRSLYVVAFSLFLITLAMNVVARFILRRYRNEYQ